MATGNPVQHPERQRIVAEEHGVCWLCGGPGANSVDHVVPRALGGSSERDNLRAAHLSCNSRRGAILGNQLRGNDGWCKTCGEAFGAGRTYCWPCGDDKARVKRQEAMAARGIVWGSGQRTGIKHADRAPCGTNAGFQNHRTDGEPPCDPCRLAHNQYSNARYHARKVGV